ncbi:hypothetical protein ACJX0J_015719 [Zea mays]
MNTTHTFHFAVVVVLLMNLYPSLDDSHASSRNKQDIWHFYELDDWREIDIYIQNDFYMPPLSLSLSQSLILERHVFLVRRIHIPTGEEMTDTGKGAGNMLFIFFGTATQAQGVYLVMTSSLENFKGQSLKESLEIDVESLHFASPLYMHDTTAKMILIQFLGYFNLLLISLQKSCGNSISFKGVDMLISHATVSKLLAVVLANAPATTCDQVFQKSLKDKITILGVLEGTYNIVICLVLDSKIQHIIEIAILIKTGLERCNFVFRTISAEFLFLKLLFGGDLLGHYLVDDGITVFLYTSATKKPKCLDYWLLFKLGNSNDIYASCNSIFSNVRLHMIKD